MRALRRLAGLSPADRRLLCGSALLLVAVWVGLLCAPFRSVRRMLGRLARPRRGAARAEPAGTERIAWAVATARRYVLPWPRTCLTQALVAQTLLARAGHPARLHFGVTKDERGRLDAHAWVESRDGLIVGHGEIERFVRLPPVETHR